MPLPHKNSGNEYFVVTEPNAALTDTAVWWANWWGKRDTEPQHTEPQHTEPQHTEPEPQQSELAHELQKLRDEKDELYKTINYLKQENRNYVQTVIDFPKLVKDNETLKIHIYYLLKAAEEKQMKNVIMHRSEGMKTEFQQEFRENVRNSKFSQQFTQEMQQINQFIKKPQFDQHDNVILDCVEQVSRNMGL
jgi:hypothetical protein